jgi:hypothetical protein
MTLFCKYKNSLGIPGKGVHKHIFGVAYFDVIGTIVIGIILSYIYPKTNIWLILFILFILGILLHRLFCVKTTWDKLIFGN